MNDQGTDLKLRVNRITTTALLIVAVVTVVVFFMAAIYLQARANDLDRCRDTNEARAGIRALVEELITLDGSFDEADRRVREIALKTLPVLDCPADLLPIHL